VSFGHFPNILKVHPSLPLNTCWQTQQKNQITREKASKRKKTKKIIAMKALEK
jgi:hypothetical protein